LIVIVCLGKVGVVTRSGHGNCRFTSGRRAFPGLMPEAACASKDLKCTPIDYRTQRCRRRQKHTHLILAKPEVPSHPISTLHITLPSLQRIRHLRILSPQIHKRQKQLPLTLPALLFRLRLFPCPRPHLTPRHPVPSSTFMRLHWLRRKHR
jgi:hypothetical protein